MMQKRVLRVLGEDVSQNAGATESGRDEDTETTTIVVEEHRFCLVVDERGEDGSRNLRIDTDESISPLVSRLERVNQKPLFTIGLFADAQFADKKTVQLEE